MIFTHRQWKSVQEDKFVLSAASIGPGELDRNAKYAFAEPPRMINPDSEGAEEIENIMKLKPLHAFRSPQPQLPKSDLNTSLRRLFAPKAQWCVAARGFERNRDVSIVKAAQCE
jgi:hypothetical protein